MMNITYSQAKQHEIKIALDLLKGAALSLQSKNINQWSFWLNPPADKIKWIQEGLDNKEFYFIRSNEQLLGMFRLQDSDLLYWGDQSNRATYIHSLVIDEKFAGNQIGKKVIDKITFEAIKKGFFYALIALLLIKSYANITRSKVSYWWDKSKCLIRLITCIKKIYCLIFQQVH